MIYEVTQDTSELNLYATGVEEIIQNVRMILTTPKGSVSLHRAFGLDMSPLDLPIELAENIATAQILEALQDFEPRVIFVSASYEKDHILGKLKVKVKVKIDEQYT